MGDLTNKDVAKLNRQIIMREAIMRHHVYFSRIQRLYKDLSRQEETLRKYEENDHMQYEKDVLQYEMTSTRNLIRTLSTEVDTVMSWLYEIYDKSEGVKNAQ